MSRGFGLLMLLTLMLAACGGNVPAETVAGESLLSAEAGPTTIQVAVASSDFEPGAPRLPLVLFDGPERVVDAQRVQLTTFDLASGTPTPNGWQGEAVSFSDYEVPYWVAYPELEHAGNWGVVAEITLADGMLTQAQFVLQVVEQVAAPGIGERPPASENRTLATEPNISKLTSAIEPNPDFYQMTVAEALASGSPTVVTFATPAFCTSKLCAPVLSSVEAVYADFGEQFNFIHIEVYKEFEPLVFADEMAEWSLTSEPWTFVLDSDGTIVQKYGGPVSPRELSIGLENLEQ